MKNKLIGCLTHNLGLKLLAVLFSVVLWLVGISINNPVDKKTFYYVPIQFLNENLITGAGKTYKEDIDDVTVTVRANRDTLNSLTSENLKVTADFSELSFTNTVPIRVEVIGITEKVESATPATDLVKLEIDNFKRKQISIVVKTTGTPAEGYAAGKITTETNAMSISGPETIVDQVENAVVEVSLEDVSSNINIEQSIKLMDQDGKEVISGELTKSISSVNVNIPIFQTKEVAVKVNLTGEPAEGFETTGVIEVDPAEITIAGKLAVISGIEEIEIPAEKVDISNASADVVRAVDISDYLPEGVILADASFDGVVEVRVKVEAVQKKVIALDPEKIQLNNVPEGYEVTLGEAQNLTVTVAGLQEKLDQLTTETLVSYIDFAPVFSEEEMPEGEMEMDVSFLLPEGVSVSVPVKAVLTVSRIEESESDSGA